MSAAPDQEALSLAQHWMTVNRPDRVLEELSRLPGDAALSRAAFVLRAAALHDLGNHQAAASAAESGLGDVGPDPQLLAILGMSRQQLGRYEAAESALLDGLALAPTSSFLLCAYARLCLTVGQVEKAGKLVERAASVDPEDDVVARTRLLVAFVQGKDSDAVKHGREAMRLDPDDGGNQLLYGLALASRGNVGAAAHSYRRAAAADPGDRELVEAAREARAAAHPLLWPLRPMQRFGPLPVWLAAVVTMTGLRAAGLAPLALVFAVLWVTYCVYSWVAPPLVRRWIRRNR